ncbi:MAG: hypothetical protein H0T79_12195, partial [Deltaproteobacteria bacterium]|nr:hypothetical protein [Deltaproteobacteria bacterium]
AVSLDSRPIKQSITPPTAPKVEGRAVAIVDPIDVEAPPVKLRSPVARVIGGLIVIGVIGVGGYLVMTNFSKQEDLAAADKARQDKLTAEREQAAAEKSRLLGQAQIDPGAILVTSTPSPAGVWLRLGRTPLDSMRLAANTTHEIAVIAEGHAIGHAQIVAANWEKADKIDARKASIAVTLEPAKPDPKTKKLPSTELPIQPKAVHAAQPEAGQGPIHIESTPSDAEVWLFIGHTGDEVRFSSLTAGREYELLVVKPGTHKPRRISIKPDEWRDGGDPNIPIDVAQKKAVIERAVELEPSKPEK